MTTNYTPPHFFQRCGALVYDTCVLFSFILLLSTVAIICNQGDSLLPYRSFFLLYLYLLSGFFLSWFWYKSGQTLGMLAWKIKIIHPQHKTLTWKQAFVRYLIASLTMPSLIGFLWCLIDRENQTIHDRIMGTRVKKVH